MISTSGLSLTALNLLIWLKSATSACVMCAEGAYTNTTTPFVCVYMTGDRNYLPVRLAAGAVEGLGWGSCSIENKTVPMPLNANLIKCGSNVAGWCGIGCDRLLSFYPVCEQCPPATYSATKGPVIVPAFLNEFYE